MQQPKPSYSQDQSQRNLIIVFRLRLSTKLSSNMMALVLTLRKELVTIMIHSKANGKKPMSGGVKYDNAKPRISLIPAVALWEESKVLTFGAQKYESHNWRKGIYYERLINAALRHLLSFSAGENLDPESGLHHLAHARCCLGFLMEYEAFPQFYAQYDDRFKYLTSPSFTGNINQKDETK